MKPELTSITGSFSRWLGGKAPNRSKRVLINEILSIQVLTTAIIGMLAVAGLYWGGQWVLQDNYGRWAQQWTEELNELGAPLYLSDDDEAAMRLESYTDKYAEIERVVYYRIDGKTLFAIDKRNSPETSQDLPDSVLLEARALVGSPEPYVMHGGMVDPRRFQILAPVWTESIPDDGLFAFDPQQSTPQSQVELIGFVGMYLDFSMFHDRLLANINTAILVLLAVLIISAAFGRRALRKALMSISDLQRPLRELAKGNLDVQFEPADHREISEIVEALESTANALSERDERLLKLANHDVLTGLYNRRRFIEELKTELGHVLTEGYTSALMFIDLDQFKYINDTCGHPAGDRMIRKVADELRRTVGHDGLVARFGGDEFAVLVSRTAKDVVKSLAESILADMRRLTHIEGDQAFHVHCSIGVTMINGTETNQDELIAQADIACREAKSAGRNRLRFYNLSEQEAQRLSTDLGWMNKLRSAVDNDEFEIRFQPINCIATGETTHHEALLRLPTDDGKLINPDAFLPAAVRFGLMSEIDLWMIRHCAEAYAKYSVADSRLRLSINLSASAFETDNLAAYIEKCFADNDVPPENVILEITESLAVRRPRDVEKQIAALRALGCELALDDFGTGYSSFSNLQRLHVDYIKIDGTFVQDILNNPVDQKMVRLIAEIGHEAGMKTIAEYVQNEKALEMLGELGVDMAQGYFIGRPVKRPTTKSSPISLQSRRNRSRRKKSHSA